MVVFNPSQNRQAADSHTPNANRLQIRYKSQTAEHSEDIGCKAIGQFATDLRKKFRSGRASPDDTDEYHFSLLARDPRRYDTLLPEIYAVDDLKSGDLDLLPEITRMRPGFDFDGPDNPNWHIQLADALLDTRRFARDELQSRQLVFEQDFDVYFTGNKGFRVLVRGLTPAAPPKALCDAMQLFCDDRQERYPTLDTGIYNPSPYSGFIRGPGSKHPKSGLWSIFITQEELFNLPIPKAITQITERATMTDHRARQALRGLDPFAFLGLSRKPGKALQSFLSELQQEAFDLAWIERFQARTQSTIQINLEALATQESLEVRSYIHENQVALLKSCPACHKPGKAWITKSGRLNCFRSSCEASQASGGLHLRKWSDCKHPEELLQVKAPEGFEGLFVSHQEIARRLAGERDLFFGEQALEAHPNNEVAYHQRVSPGCKKSTFALDGLIEAVLAGKIVAFTTPNHDLTNAKLVDLQRMAKEKGVEIQTMKWLGRSAHNENGPVCKEPQRVEHAVQYGLPIQKFACRKCPLFRTCAYQKQRPELQRLVAEAKETGVGLAWLGTHHALWALTQNEEIFDPERVIIDEDPVGACLNDYTFTYKELLAPYVEPEGLEVDLKAAYEPVQTLLRQATDKARQLHQKDYDREFRKARRKGTKWRPRPERRVAQQGLLDFLLEHNPEAPALFQKAIIAILAAREELLTRSEEEQANWLIMLGATLRVLPLLQALSARMNPELSLLPAQNLPKTGYSVELSFALELLKTTPKSTEKTQEAARLGKQKLVGGIFLVQEAKPLPYKGPVLGLDATGEELPWQAMLGRPIETLRLDAPLHPESTVDWFELGTYQSELLKQGEIWIDRYLIPHIRHHHEQGKKILILTWLKESAAGSYKEKVINRLEEAGLPVDGIQLDVAHFFSERGHNRWRAWDVAMLWGMPVENPDALRMKCEALSQLVPEEQREALREQLHYQYSAGEGLQGLHRVGAIVEAKQWLIFASSRFLPLGSYLKDVSAPGQFRKWDGRSNEAKDPSKLEKLDELARQITAMGFSNQRAIAGLVGLDPVARGALIRMGLLDPGKVPLGVVPQGFDHIPIKSGKELQGSVKNYRDVIETYSAKAFRDLFGPRELARISSRTLELSEWSKEDVVQVVLQDDDGTLRPYRVVGDEALGRSFLELCLELEEKKVQGPGKVFDFSFDADFAQDWKERFRFCQTEVELFLARWLPDVDTKQDFAWTDEARLWAYWVVCQWQDEHKEAKLLGELEALGEKEQIERAPP